MIIDSHCHIPLISKNKVEQAKIIKRAVDAGVQHMLCVCVDLDSIDDVLYCAKNFKEVSASVGVHPTFFEGDIASVEEIAALAEDSYVVEIGETGLDFYHDGFNVARQTEQFRNHIICAKDLNKPLIIHCRNSADNLIKIMTEENAGLAGGVMHCFVEDWKTAKAAMDLGFFISFSGILTFKNARELQEVAKKIPLERILVETDSPWLSPVPLRGKTNQPAHVVHTLRFLADLRGEDVDLLANKTSENFCRLFGVKQLDANTTTIA